MRKFQGKRLLSLLTSVAILMSMCSVSSFARNSDGSTTIKIFHTNDVHSRYQGTVGEDGTLENFGYDRLKTLIRQETSANDNVLLFDAGDTFHGQPFATISEGASIAKLMRAVGYDAMVAGNHDFNYGSARTPVLANTAYTTLLGSNVKRAGKTAKGFTDYEVFEEDGVKIGVFGLSTPETKYKTNPKNVQFIQFADPTKTAQEMVDVLRDKEKVDVIVCVSHLGIDEDSKGIRSTDVAENVDGIDVIIDGHSHSTPDSYDVVNDTIITSAGEYMHYVGVVTIDVDEQNNITIDSDAYMASDYTDESLPADQNVTRVIESIAKEQESTINKVVASTPVKLDGERENVRTGETNLARLTTSAMLNETGADIALTNGGGLRASIEAGDITVGSVQNVLPFGNYIITVKLTGKQLKEAVENGLPGRDGDGLEVLGKKIQVAGLDVAYDPSKPAGNRIVSISHNGEAIDDSKTYTVATNDFMQNGGDEYTSLHQPIENEFAALDEALIRYIEKIGTNGIKQISEESPRVHVA